GVPSSSGTWVPTGSSRRSSPRSTSCMTSTPVNVLECEAMRKRWSLVSFSPVSTSAVPQARSTSTSPRRPTASWRPGSPWYPAWKEAHSARYGAMERRTRAARSAVTGSVVPSRASAPRVPRGAPVLAGAPGRPGAADQEQDGDHDDDLLEHAHALLDDVPLVAEQVARTAEDRVPHARAEGREGEEPPHGHALDAGGDGDEAAHDGDEAADQHRPVAVPGEPVLGLVDVLELHQGHAVDDAPQAVPAEPRAQPVQEGGTDDGARRRPDEDLPQDQ